MPETQQPLREVMAPEIAPVDRETLLPSSGKGLAREFFYGG